MAGKRHQLYWLGLLMGLTPSLGLAESASAVQESASDTGSSPEISAEFLLFIAEWSDDKEWIDPMTLDQAMTDAQQAPHQTSERQQTSVENTDEIR